MRRVHGRNMNRGLVSHVKSQASGLASMISGAWGLIVSSTLDDASMWVQTPGVANAPPPQADAGPRGVAKKRHRRNLHMPTLNHVQKIHALRCLPSSSDNDAPLVRVGLAHTPTTVLPKGNWRTVHQRWTNWTLLSSSGPGRNISALDATLQDVVSAVPLSALFFALTTWA